MDAPTKNLDSKAITRLLLDEGREVLLRTVGLSMGYSIRGGEGVVIKAVSENQIRFGDVIVFEWQGQLVCHRVVRSGLDSQGRVFLTKGDPLVRFDEKVDYKDVLGKVVRIKWPEGDFYMEGPRGRAFNVFLALMSLGLGALYIIFPFKGILNRSNRGWAIGGLYRLFAFPSKAARKLAK